MGGLFLKPHFSGCLNHYLSPYRFRSAKSSRANIDDNGKIRAAQPFLLFSKRQSRFSLSQIHLFRPFCYPASPLKSVNRRKGI